VRVAAALAAACLWAASAAAQVGVDTALVLAVDASGSIDTAEFRLQKEGIAGAVTDPQVLRAMQGGIQGRVALAYVEWGGPGMAATVVDWIVIDGRAAAERFAAAVVAAPRSPQSYNALGDAIDHAAALLDRCPCTPSRRVIDISGDNPDNRSARPAPMARDAAVRAGITVNALAILEDGGMGARGKPWLVENYEAEVIGGPGAFVEVARDRADFAAALRRKMILEIAGGTVRGFAGR